MDQLLVKKERDKEVYWSTLIWNMAMEDKTQYDSLMRTEVSEFFQLLKTYSKNMELRKAAANKQTNKNRHGR